MAFFFSRWGCLLTDGAGGFFSISGGPPTGTCRLQAQHLSASGSLKAEQEGHTHWPGWGFHGDRPAIWATPIHNKPLRDFTGASVNEAMPWHVPRARSALGSARGARRAAARAERPMRFLVTRLSVCGLIEVAFQKLRNHLENDIVGTFEFGTGLVECIFHCLGE